MCTRVCDDVDRCREYNVLRLRKRREQAPTSKITITRGRRVWAKMEETMKEALLQEFKQLQKEASKKRGLSLRSRLHGLATYLSYNDDKNDIVAVWAVYHRHHLDETVPQLGEAPVKNFQHISL